MTKLPICNYRELSRIAEACGFSWARRRGSHNAFRNAQGKTVVIPDHGSAPIVRPLLRKILRDMELSPEDYIRLMEDL